jgi:hypothetical protein
MFRATLTSSVLFTGLLALGQTMDLPTGSLQVAAGTRLRIDGPVTWTIGDGAQVVNDGRIELLNGAQLEEAVGSPVTGLGTEHAHALPGAPLDGSSIAGLGLGLETTTIADSVLVTRGHAPVALPAGPESIARWFEVRSSGAALPAATLRVRYDATELNGNDPAQLKLHEAAELIGPWTQPSISVLEAPDLITTTDPTPGGFYTAFDVDVTTALSEPAVTNGYQVWPTVSDDLVHVRAVGAESIRSVDLFGPTGRSVLPGLTLTDRHAVIDLSGLASGIYLLRVNGGRTTQKLIKP